MKPLTSRHPIASCPKQPIRLNERHETWLTTAKIVEPQKAEEQDSDAKMRDSGGY